MTAMMIFSLVLFGMFSFVAAGILAENPFASSNRTKRKAKYTRIKNMIRKHPKQEKDEPLERQPKGRLAYWKTDVKMVVPFIRGPTDTFRLT